MQTVIGITPSHLLEVAQSLNTLLADEHILYIKTRRAHWNVEGSDFVTAHRFFEEQYKQIEEAIDGIAERIRTIGHYAEATLTAFLKETHLSEETRDRNNSIGLIRSLLKDHETITIHLRELVGKCTEVWKDVGTADFITRLLKMHEKMAWMLGAHLK